MAGGQTDRLAAELRSLKVFKGQVDDLLTELNEGAAAPGRVAGARLGTDHLGANFPEVYGLYGAYNALHARLETLAGLLSDQIEALSTAVHGARVGYANVDAELRERLWAIQRRTKELYAAPAPPDGRRPGSDEGSI
ncbi:hypothetical protein AB0K09_05015 [Streptomyces sp. NPDC049577]|uniref:hypothetical protein n=1 Tax=Streptomyces sp. NPDC049577 TaxID=3155153 RepID=UPI0034401586